MPAALLIGSALDGGGCSSVGDREQAAGGVALRWFTALGARDGTTACDLLAPDTPAEVAQSGGKACPQAGPDQDLPAPGVVTRTSVYGQWAQVKLTGDTVFLAVFPGGWRVVAA